MWTVTFVICYTSITASLKKLKRCENDQESYLVSPFFSSYSISVFSFSPPKFSSAGPFKSSIDCEPDLFSPTSPPGAAPVPVPLENGAASQPIRTPARNKKQKGHRRWGGNVQRASLYCRTLARLTFCVVYSDCWGKVLMCFVFAGIMLFEVV